MIDEAVMKSTIEQGPHDVPAVRRALSAFAQVAAAAEGTTQLDDVLQVVAAQICKLVGVSRCSIHLRDDRVGLFVGTVCEDNGPKAMADIKRSRAGCPADGITRELLRTRRPVIVENAEEDPAGGQVDRPLLADPVDHGGADDLRRRGDRRDLPRRRSGDPRLLGGGRGDRPDLR